MLEKILIAVMLVCGLGSASVWTTINMVDGADSFSDTFSLSGEGSGMAQYSLSNSGMSGQNAFEMGPGKFEFSETTTSSWLKQNYLSDDPYVGISKAISNTGSGIATSNMQFSDTPLGFSLLSGFTVDDQVDSSGASMYATDFQSWTVNNQIGTTAHNLDFLAGQKFDRITWDLDNIWQFKFV
jgi:hypothetical protein